MGIEILPELHTHGLIALEHAQKEAAEAAAAAATTTAATATSATSAGAGGARATVMAPMSLREGDFLRDTSWTDADVVFMNSTAFGSDLMSKISTVAEGMRKGTRLISLTIGLSTPAFKLVAKQDFLMSWGEATALFHERI